MVRRSATTLTDAMDKYTKWIDGQLDFAGVDQNVDQIQKKDSKKYGILAKPWRKCMGIEPTRDVFSAPLRI
jgi:hypothetical protein